MWDESSRTPGRPSNADPGRDAVTPSPDSLIDAVQPRDRLRATARAHDPTERQTASAAGPSTCSSSARSVGVGATLYEGPSFSVRGSPERICTSKSTSHSPG